MAIIHQDNYGRYWQSPRGMGMEMEERRRVTMTTVRQDFMERARMAVELLEELMGGDVQGRIKLLGLEIVERGSVGYVEYI